MVTNGCCNFAHANVLLQASERFLQQMVSLYVSSHYKNTPNDLLLMADAPAHHLFALLAPLDETQVRATSRPVLVVANHFVLWCIVDAADIEHM
jgi:tRNA(Met) C34 N-acetyltransferase TmcA